MKGRIAGNITEVFESLPSTNTYCKELLQKRRVPEGFVVWAKSQTAGRGQGENRWESEPGRNLTFSIILYPTFLNAEDQFLLSMIVSLAVADTLKAYSGKVCIKWPNDIYVEEKKIAGILIENSIIENRITETIAGVGLNINQKKFGKHLSNPVSLARLTGRSLSPHECLESICRGLDYWYYKLRNNRIEEIKNSYTTKLYRLKEEHKFKDKDGTFTGSIRGVDKYGRLIIKTSRLKERHYGMKEIVFLPSDKPSGR